MSLTAVHPIDVNRLTSSVPSVKVTSYQAALKKEAEDHVAREAYGAHRPVGKCG
jgi:hypothetical protein